VLLLLTLERLLRWVLLLLLQVLACCHLPFVLLRCALPPVPRGTRCDPQQS
jgi:hypothetical protein